MRYPAVLFDLFRTVVLYREGTVTNKVHQPHWREAMLDLTPRFRAAAPGIDVESFLNCLVVATDQIAAERGTEMREVPIEMRYERALLNMGTYQNDTTTAARGLAEVQLEAQMDGTVVPASHHSVLAALARDRRLALVSNFDDAASVRSMLDRHQLTPYFSTILISVEHGRRKPHPAIFNAALDALDATAHDALHVGDSLGPDVKGAQAAGIDVAWVNPSKKRAPTDTAPPTYEIASIADLARTLGVSVTRSERQT